MLSYLKIWASIVLLCFVTSGCAEKDKDDDQDSETDSDPPNGSGPSTTIGKVALGDFDRFPSSVDPVTKTDTPSEKTEAFDSGTVALSTEYDLTLDGELILGSVTQQDFNNVPNAAFGACQMVNRMRGLLHLAAQPEKVYCEVAFLTRDKNLFDGATHILEEQDMDDDGNPNVRRWKFAFEGTQEAPKSITMYQCEGGVQNHYMKKVINEDRSVTILSKRFSQPDNPQVDSFRSLMTVKGTLNEEYEFQDLKNIHQIYSNNFSSGATSLVEEYAVQSSQNFQYSGVMTQSDKSDADKYLSFVQLLDENTPENQYDIGKLGLGEGAMLFTAGSSTRTQGWSGTGALDNENPRIDRIKDLGSKLLPNPAATDLSFNSEETWDCSGQADMEVTYDEVEAMIVELENQFGEGADFCGGFELPQNNYLQCQNYKMDGI